MSDTLSFEWGNSKIQIQMVLFTYSMKLQTFVVNLQRQSLGLYFHFVIDCD